MTVPTAPFGAERVWRAGRDRRLVNIRLRLVNPSLRISPPDFIGSESGSTSAQVENSYTFGERWWRDASSKGAPS